MPLTYNGLQLQEVGDFEAQNCQPTTHFIRCTKLQTTTEPPIFCRCCYVLPFFRSKVCRGKFSRMFARSFCVGLAALLLFLGWLLRLQKSKCATKSVGLGWHILNLSVDYLDFLFKSFLYFLMYLFFSFAVILSNLSALPSMFKKSFGLRTGGLVLTLNPPTKTE